MFTGARNQFYLKLAIENEEDNKEHFTTFDQGEENDKMTILHTKASSADCDEQKAYFRINTKFTDGDLVRLFRSKDNHDKTLMLYNTAQYTEGAKLYQMEYAHRIEKWLVGKMSWTDPRNQYRPVFRYPSSAGISFYDYFYTGVTDPKKDS